MPPCPAPLFPCGESASRLPLARVKALVQRASEARQLAKAQGLAPRFASLTQDQQEWLLFSKLFRALGYGGWQDAFEGLAESSPLPGLRQTLLLPDGPHRVLGRWAGALGLLQDTPSWHPQAQAWARELLPHAGSPLSNLPPVAGRPQNHPLRRLCGLLHHVQATQDQGLLKSWLKLLWEAEAQLQQGKGLKGMQAQVARLFPTPPDAPLARLLTPKAKSLSPKPLTLIGEERQLVLLVNAVIPFFLAYALSRQDQALEKTLFGLFLLLPCEGENHKTLAMEARLLAQTPPWGRKNLAYAQGLIQLYEDWCGPAPACNDCGLLRLLQGEHGARANVGEQL